MKFLIIRIGAIGDVIMTTPIVKAIKKRYPNSHITYIVGKWASEVLKNNPYIDKLMVVKEDIFLKKKMKDIKSLIHKLKSEHFDYGFVLDKSWMFNLFLFLCGTKRRYGFSREHHFINKVLLTKQVRFSGKKKEYEYYGDLLYTSLGLKYNYGDMALYPTKQEKSAVDQYMNGYKWKFNCVAPGGAVNPGQKALQKRWPKKYYGKVIDHLLWKGKKVFIFGGDGDKRYNRFPKFEDDKNYYNLTGVYNIREVYHFLRKYCDTFIGQDTGTLHLAAAAKVKKIIALFGPTPHERFAPKNAIVVIPKDYTPSYDVYGNFLYGDISMKKIYVEQVIEVLK